MAHAELGQMDAPLLDLQGTGPALEAADVEVWLVFSKQALPPSVCRCQSTVHVSPYRRHPREGVRKAAIPSSIRSACLSGQDEQHAGLALWWWAWS